MELRLQKLRAAIREEFRWKHFGFNLNDVCWKHIFTTSPMNIRPRVLLCFRFFSCIAFFLVLGMDMKKDSGHLWFIYLSNWTFFVHSVSFLLLTILSSSAQFCHRHGQKQLQCVKTKPENAEVDVKNVTATETIVNSVASPPYTKTEETRQSTPRVEETRQSTPRVEETRQSTPRVEETRQSTPRVEENRQSTPLVEENRQSLPEVEESRQCTPPLEESQQCTTSPRLEESHQCSPRSPNGNSSCQNVFEEAQDQQQAPSSPPEWLLKAAWLVHDISLPKALFVTIIYWTVLYPNTPKTDMLIVVKHVLNSVFVILNASISRVPILLTHVIYPVVYGIAYSIWTIVHWYFELPNANGGIGLIYEQVDYNTKPFRSTATVIVLSICAIPAIHFMFWCLFKGRNKIFLKIAPTIPTSKER